MELNVYVDFLALIIVWVIGFACRKKRDRSYEYKLFFAMTVVIAATLSADMLSCAFDGVPSLTPLVYALIAVYFFFRVIYSYLWLLFTIALCSGNRMDGKCAALLFIPAFVEVCIISLNFKTGWLFTYDQAGYARGVLYWPHLFIFGFYIVCSIASAVYWYRKSQDAERKRQCLYSLLYLFLPLCGAVLEVYNSDISWIFPFAALSQLMMHLNFREHEEALLQRQLTQNRINIMLSQIQPHFLYNSLTAIAQLCEKDPKKAKETTLFFSEYLRNNMQALDKIEPIPFERELEHVKAYLCIEQVRFGDKLRVEYDIAATDFYVPALSLQPIVENAVKHGVNPKEEGGTVRIRTRELPDCFEITVADDGVGCDLAHFSGDGKRHIGINSVRERLDLTMGAELSIESRIGHGTTAVMRIFKRETP